MLPSNLSSSREDIDFHIHSIQATVPPYGGRIAQLPFQGTRLRTKTLIEVTPNLQGT